MKNIFRNILLSGVAVTMFASCNLDLLPSTAIPYEDGDLLILSQQDVVEWQNGVLASYRGLSYGTHYQTVEVMSECFNATVHLGNNYGFSHRLGKGFDASNGEVESIWAAHYGAIKTYNVVIEQCGMIEEESLLPQANVLKGFALYCRASSYLALARAFSADYDPATAETELSVPLILKYNQYAKPTRATLQEVYDQIFEDLDEAEVLLSDAAENGDVTAVNGARVNLYGAPKSYVPTVDAVKALKARYYLDIHEYADAADYAEQVIDSDAQYALAASADDMINEFDLDEGNESLIRLYVSEGDGFVGCSIYTGVQETTDDGKFFVPMFLPSQEILDAYDEGDLRKKQWFPNKKYPVKGSTGTLHEGVHVFTKYLGNPNLQQAELEDSRHYAKPLMLAEMYLIAAEAYAQDGDEGAAKKLLNKLQTARKANPTDGSLESVKQEWLRETVGDGQRINCIKRWGDGLPARPAQDAMDGFAEDVVVLNPASEYVDREVEADSHTLVWPIPSYELKITPSLQQNPGYSAQ